MTKRIWVAAGLMLALAACNDQYGRSTKHLSPIPPATLSLMAQKGLSKSDPILIRAYKKESELEVWKRGADGKYVHLKTYPICRWSGQLGPKIREGDRQAPEGFYTITPAHMNPNSSYYLSFDTGYPNAYDRAHGRTGSHLMVHGSCSSRGCFAMTDEAIAEVYAIGREAFAGGQRSFQFQSYPFRMTPENLAKHRADPHMPFWRNLKEGSDYFEATGEEPKVAVCNKRYVFGGADVAQGNCSPEVPPAVAAKRAEDERKVAELIAKGTPAIRLVYEDGGQHASFREVLTASAHDDGNFAVLSARPRRTLGDISRPEALAAGPREIIVEDGRGPGKPAAALAFASTKPTAKAAEPTPAAAARAEAAASATESEATSLYDRMFGRLFGASSSPGTPQAEPAAPPAGAAPLPPRRGASAAGGRTPGSDQRVDAGSSIKVARRLPPSPDAPAATTN